MKIKLTVRFLILVSLFIFSCTGQGKINLSSHSIYISPAAPESVKQSAEELKSYFNKVAGISPEIIISDQVPSTPFISLGTNPASEAAGIDAESIPMDGYRIVTKGKNVYVIGPDTPTGEINHLGGVNRGTMNGVYSFIEEFLGVEWVMTGELGENYKKLKRVSIPETDKMESSPFNYRVQSFRSQSPLDDEWDRHLKLARVAAVQHSHAWVQTIPASLYDKHPDFFAQIGGKNVPPSGRYKLETTNPALVQAYADSIIARFGRNPGLKWYSLSPTDGSYGWSDSKESLALTEKDPFGNLSRTPLILKFYNDVAKIVGKEFPDRKLGGYIYSMYLYPPSGGLPKLEPNLALVVATSISYGYQLYRQSTRDNWDNLMKTWGESAKKDGFDLYYYDLPVSIMQPNGILWPPAPDMLNFIFTRLSQYGFKGAYVYGNPVWPVFGPGNYAIAKLQWNPDQDANQILNKYYASAYGEKAGPYIKQLMDVLDTSWNKYMNAHPRANYSLTEDHLKEIYGPSYPEIEKIYLEADKVSQEPKQEKRLELFGQVMSLMQWNLKKLGLLPADYSSALTKTDEEVDEMLSNQQPDGRITRIGNFRIENTDGIVHYIRGENEEKSVIPVNGTLRMLLYTKEAGEVKVNAKAFNSRGEFITYTLSRPNGEQIRMGAMFEGKVISFPGEAGKSYLLDIQSRGAQVILDVEGASAAYKSNMQDDAIQFAGGKYMKIPVSTHFYVPENIRNFHVTLGANGAKARVYYPSGDQAGVLDCSKEQVSRIDFKHNGSKAGFWKIVVDKYDGSTVSLTLDEELQPWVGL